MIDNINSIETNKVIHEITPLVSKVSYNFLAQLYKSTIKYDISNIHNNAVYDKIQFGGSPTASSSGSASSGSASSDSASSGSASSGLASSSTAPELPTIKENELIRSEGESQQIGQTPGSLVPKAILPRKLSPLSSRFNPTLRSTANASEDTPLDLPNIDQYSDEVIDFDTSPTDIIQQQHDDVKIEELNTVVNQIKQSLKLNYQSINPDNPLQELVDKINKELSERKTIFESSLEKKATLLELLPILNKDINDFDAVNDSNNKTYKKITTEQYNSEFNKTIQHFNKTYRFLRKKYDKILSHSELYPSQIKITEHMLLMDNFLKLLNLSFKAFPSFYNYADKNTPLIENFNTLKALFSQKVKEFKPFRTRFNKLSKNLTRIQTNTPDLQLKKNVVDVVTNLLQINTIIVNLNTTLRTISGHILTCINSECDQTSYEQIRININKVKLSYNKLQERIKTITNKSSTISTYPVYGDILEEFNKLKNNIETISSDYINMLIKKSRDEDITFKEEDGDGSILQEDGDGSIVQEEGDGSILQEKDGDGSTYDDGKGVSSLIAQDEMSQIAQSTLHNYPEVPDKYRKDYLRTQQVSSSRSSDENTFIPLEASIVEEPRRSEYKSIQLGYKTQFPYRRLKKLTTALEHEIIRSIQNRFNKISVVDIILYFVIFVIFCGTIIGIYFATRAILRLINKPKQDDNKK